MNPILLDIPMPITTDRLIIRPLQPGDGSGLNAAILESYEELEPWIPWATNRPTVADSEEVARRAFAKWILREDLRMVILARNNVDVNTPKILGEIGLHRVNWRLPSFEVGYWLRNSAVGQGYVSEAVKAVTKFCFVQLKAKRVEAKCNTENTRSLAVLKKLGFDAEGVLKNTDFHSKTEHRDLIVYARVNANGL